MNWEPRNTQSAAHTITHHPYSPNNTSHNHPPHINFTCPPPEPYPNHLVAPLTFSYRKPTTHPTHPFTIFFQIPLRHTQHPRTSEESYLITQITTPVIESSRWEGLRSSGLVRMDASSLPPSLQVAPSHAIKPTWFTYARHRNINISSSAVNRLAKLWAGRCEDLCGLLFVCLNKQES